MPDETLPAHPASPDPPQLPEILTRYRAGESIQTLAAECHVAPRTIYRWMLGGLGDKAYHQLITECLIDRVADADMLLASAPDACQIARAREIARFARMDLERRRPGLYGPKQEYTSEKIVVHVHRRADEGQNTQTIDVTPQEDSDAH